MKHVNLFFVGLLFSSFVFADSSATMSNSNNWTWVGSISAGPSWENAGETQTFSLAPDIERTYSAKRDTNDIPTGELFIGMQRNLPHEFQGQLGFVVAATSGATLSGNIWEDADPTFNNYKYSYQIQHSYVGMQGKLLADRGYFLIPWISASVGAGFNRAFGFRNIPLINEAIVTPNFTSNIETSFSYTLGIGVQKKLDQHWQAGIGYEFADWGQSQLGKASGQTLNYGLLLNHFYTNSMMLNLTYVA